MRFMILVQATKTSEAGVLPDEKLLTEMSNEELMRFVSLDISKTTEA